MLLDFALSDMLSVLLMIIVMVFQLTICVLSMFCAFKFWRSEKGQRLKAKNAAFRWAVSIVCVSYPINLFPPSITHSGFYQTAGCSRVVKLLRAWWHENKLWKQSKWMIILYDSTSHIMISLIPILWNLINIFKWNWSGFLVGQWPTCVASRKVFFFMPGLLML